MKIISFDSATMLLYVIAAIAGGLGGCAAAAYYTTHTSAPRLHFTIAYVLLGAVFGIVALSALAVWPVMELDSLHHVILYALLSGSAGSLALISANVTIMVILKRLGIELQITMRKSGEERRSNSHQLGKDS